MQISINNIDYTIDVSKGKLQASYSDPETGLGKRFVFNFFEIELTNKRITTVYHSYDVTPTGKLINRQEHKYTSLESDFDDFEDGTIGIMIKAATINGLFRFIFKNSYRIFSDVDGQLITAQPVAFPESEIESNGEV